jgi:cell division protein ZipA
LDTKDIILLGGGPLLIAVIGHGIWVARRARRGDLKMDISPKNFRDVDGELFPEEPGMRGELPNGGARIVSVAEDLEPRQVSLELDSDPLKARRDERHKSAQERKEKAKALYNSARKTSAQKQRQAERAELEKRAEEHSGLTELIVLHVLARPEQTFAGADLVAALRNEALRFGEMNIFHYLHEDTGSQLYSVANAIEPGTFDLADLSALCSPGLTFFLQLPAKVDGIEALEHMLEAAQSVANTLGGDLKDENMSALTGQTVEHLRERVSDFARRYLTQQAYESDA